MKASRMPVLMMIALALGFFAGSKSLAAKYPPWGR
jgi:hypothetical protein